METAACAKWIPQRVNAKLSQIAIVTGTIFNNLIRFLALRALSPISAGLAVRDIQRTKRASAILIEKRRVGALKTKRGRRAGEAIENGDTAGKAAEYQIR